jgi:hypothetical protein
MEDERAATRAPDDSPLIRRQILICQLRLVLRAEADLRPRERGRGSRLTLNGKIARDRASHGGGSPTSSSSRVQDRGRARIHTPKEVCATPHIWS